MKTTVTASRGVWRGAAVCFGACFVVLMAIKVANSPEDGASYGVFPEVAEERLRGFRGVDPPTAADYELLFAYFVEGWETYRSTAGASANVPGLPSRHGSEVDALEAFSRTVPLVAAWLNSGRPSQIALSDGRVVDLVELVRRGIVAGTDSNSPAYWGEIRSLDQRIVEASDIALSLWLTRAIVWPRLTLAEKNLALSWLDQVNGKEVPDNNWHLFVPFVNAVRGVLGADNRRGASLMHYNRFKTFYRGNGWFSDGPSGTFDYYNAWAIHYLLFWLDAVDPQWDPGFIGQADRAFLSNYPYLIGAHGLPIMGRSVCYRMAAAAPMVFGTTASPDLVSASVGRRALDAVWTYFIREGSVRKGLITQGYCGTDARIVDTYSGPSSCLWALRSLIPAFSMPRNSAFWRGAPGLLAVDTGDYVVKIPEIGWTVSGERASGAVTIHRSDSLPSRMTRVQEYNALRRLGTSILWRPFRPDNQHAKYERGTYRSTQPFCGCK